jgi:integrase
MLSHDVMRYVELHRAVGFKYKVQAYLLRNFAAFAEDRADEHVRTETVLVWAAQAPSAGQRRNRLLNVRRFALAMQAEDARHQVPPVDAFGRNPFMRRIPHIFSRDEILRLLRTAANLLPEGSVRPATYTTLFALIATTGLRISEALKLKLNDITDDGLVIQATKFRKNRLVPLHETTRLGLKRYLDIRARLGTPDPAVFVSHRGTALAYSTAIQVFLRLTRLAGLRDGPGHPGPRIHDLRHTFAVRSLEQCSSDRKAIARHMVALSTYLGHAHISDTYWYLQATPKLLEAIATSAEALYAGGEP